MTAPDLVARLRMMAVAFADAEGPQEEIEMFRAAADALEAALNLCEAVRAATVRADQTIAADDLSLYLAQDALRTALAAEPRCTCAASRCLHEKGCPALAAAPEAFLPLRDKPTETASSDHPCALQDAEPTSGSGPMPNTGTYFESAPPSPERERLAERLENWESHRLANPGYAIGLPTLESAEEVALVSRLLRAAMDVEPHPALTCGDCGAPMMHACVRCHPAVMGTEPSELPHTLGNSSSGAAYRITNSTGEPCQVAAVNCPEPSDEAVARELMCGSDLPHDATVPLRDWTISIVRAVTAARERARKGEGT
jgi:hypothetical protein